MSSSSLHSSADALRLSSKRAAIMSSSSSLPSVSFEWVDSTAAGTHLGFLYPHRQTSSSHKVPEWLEYHDAASTGNIEKLSAILASFDNDIIAIDIADFDGRTALHKASFYNRLSCVELLLRLGANPLAADRGGCLPLHYAIMGGAKDSVEKLLSLDSIQPILKGHSVKSIFNEPKDFVRIFLKPISHDISSLIFSADRLSVINSNTETMPTVYGNYGISKGKFYFEVTLHTNCPYLRIGWVVKEKAWLSNVNGVGLGHDEYSFAFEGGQGVRRHKGLKKPYGGCHRLWREGDIIGCLIDLDSKNGFIQYTINGHPLAFKKVFKKTRGEGELIYPAISLQYRSWCRVNFGYEEFVYDEVLENGYSAYCDAPLFHNSELVFQPALSGFIAAPYFGQESIYSWTTSVGNLDCLKLLVSRSNATMLHTTSALGMTPMHFSCMFGHSNIVRYLLSTTTSRTLLINQPENCGVVPLHHAVASGSKDCFELLMNTPEIDTGAVDYVGHTTLSIILELRKNYKEFYQWVPKLLNDFKVELTIREWSLILPFAVMLNDDLFSQLFHWKVTYEPASKKLRGSCLEDENLRQYLRDKSELIRTHLQPKCDFTLPTLSILNARMDLLIQALLYGNEDDEIVKNFIKGKWVPQLNAIVRLANCKLLQMEGASKGRVVLTSSEERRNKCRVFVFDFFQQLSFVAKALGVNLHYKHLDLSHTESSLRSVISLPFANQIDTLDLSFTLISWRSLAYLNFMPNLSKLFLNHCPKLTRGGSEEEKVFEQLKQKPHQSLEIISLIETSTNFTTTWLNNLEVGCPKLTMLYFTSRKGEKIVGLADVVMMQTMLDPHLLPCGHIADKPTLDGLVRKECFFDRKPFNLSEVIRFTPHITKLEKVLVPLLPPTSPLNDSGNKGPPSSTRKHSVSQPEEFQWKATIVDAWPSCRELESKVLLHVKDGCGEFFNLSTFERYYCLASLQAPNRRNSSSFGLGSMSGTFENRLSAEELIRRAQESKWICTGCNKELTGLRVCYPNSDGNCREFVGLETISAYIST